MQIFCISIQVADTCCVIINECTVVKNHLKEMTL